MTVSKDANFDNFDRDYFCVCGKANASTHFVKRLYLLAWQRRLLYNSAIDPKIPFAKGVDYRVARSNARRDKLADPEAPVKNATFLPVPTSFALHAELTKIRERHPMFADFTCEAQRTALDEAYCARKKHVKDCVAAKAANKPLPRLRYRSIADDIDVSSEGFRITRAGADNPQPNPKKKLASVRNRNRRLAWKAEREGDWIAKKQKSGWSEMKIALRLEKRRQKFERSRLAQQERQKAQRDFIGPIQKLARRDSPAAIVGHEIVRIKIHGLSKIRVRLTRPIPKGATVVRVHFTKQAGAGNRIKAHLVVSLPANIPELDPMAIGQQIHETMRHLPPDAKPLQAVEAARAVGLKVRGEDSGNAHPSVDDEGTVTPPVRRPRNEVTRVKALQRKIAHKDEGQKQNASNKPNSIKIRRSKRAKKLIHEQRRIHKKWAQRSRTQAFQDANKLARNQILVATDPARMVAPLLKKDGPAERRAKAKNGKTQGADNASEDLGAFKLNAAKRRAMRANLHQTRIGLRIQHVALLSVRQGFIHATPGHEGTTKSCPKCLAVKAKSLNERTHNCPCGLKMPRDQASAIVTLGRALLSFRESPDPGNRIAIAIQAKAETRTKTAKLKASRSAIKKTKNVQGVAALSGSIPAEHQEIPSGFKLRHYLETVGVERAAPGSRQTTVTPCGTSPSMAKFSGQHTISPGKRSKTCKSVWVVVNRPCSSDSVIASATPVCAGKKHRQEKLSPDRLKGGGPRRPRALNSASAKGLTR